MEIRSHSIVHFNFWLFLSCFIWIRTTNMYNIKLLHSRQTAGVNSYRAWNKRYAAMKAKPPLQICPIIRSEGLEGVWWLGKKKSYYVFFKQPFTISHLCQSAPPHTCTWTSCAGTRVNAKSAKSHWLCSYYTTTSFDALLPWFPKILWWNTPNYLTMQLSVLHLKHLAALDSVF